MICIWSSWCHCHSITSRSSKIQNGLPFWCRLSQVVLEKRPLNGCSSVVVVVVTQQAILGVISQPAPQIRVTILALYKLVCMYVCIYVCNLGQLLGQSVLLSDKFHILQHYCISRTIPWRRVFPLLYSDINNKVHHVPLCYDLAFKLHIITYVQLITVT